MAHSGQLRRYVAIIRVPRIYEVPGTRYTYEYKPGARCVSYLRYQYYDISVIKCKTSSSVKRYVSWGFIGEGEPLSKRLKLWQHNSVARWLARLSSPHQWRRKLRPHQICTVRTCFTCCKNHLPPNSEYTSLPTKTWASPTDRTHLNDRIFVWVRLVSRGPVIVRPRNEKRLRVASQPYSPNNWTVRHAL